MKYLYEIYLRHAQVEKAAWHEFLLQMTDFLGRVAHYQIYVQYQQNTLHYYLETTKPVPVSLGLLDFLCKPVEIDLSELGTAKSRGRYRNDWADNFVAISQDLYKKQYEMRLAKLDLHGFKKLIAGDIQIFYQRAKYTYHKQLWLFAPATFLSVDFDKQKSFLYKKFPKYLKLEKVTKYLSTQSEGALLEIDPFPYAEQPLYLTHEQYDFAKHSLIIGSSGSGKSKFIASLIDKIYQTQAQAYKVVVIDPHDALYKECTNIDSRAVINFQDLANSIDLFKCQVENINANVELMLTLFRSLINNDYNGRLERVLRYSTYLLTLAGQFSFLTLRKLLLDMEYRNEIVAQYQAELPASVAHFFLTDFNELKNQNYNDAIAPIIVFIDEMQMVPVFNEVSDLEDLAQKVQTSFLNIFSLNRLKLGSKVTQTIAGLLLQQLFLLAQQNLDQHLLVIIDEVAVVQNPIISRFLAELRKYNASVILAGQYFAQIEDDLQAAIFANVSNYYLFRVSQADAEILTRNINIKLANSDKLEDAQSLLTGLKLRECLARICVGEEALPIFKARTTDYEAKAQPQTVDLLDQTFDFTDLSKYTLQAKDEQASRKVKDQLVAPAPAAQEKSTGLSNFSTLAEQTDQSLLDAAFQLPSAEPKTIAGKNQVSEQVPAAEETKASEQSLATEEIKPASTQKLEVTSTIKKDLSDFAKAPDEVFTLPHQVDVDMQRSEPESSQTDFDAAVDITDFTKTFTTGRKES